MELAKPNMEIRDDSPQVIALPPFIYLSGLVLGVILHWFYPLAFLPGKLTLSLGTLCILVSIVLVVTAMRAFRKAKTNIDTRKPTTSIVTAGPYRFSRNPIYLSMTLLFVGIAILVNSLWILLALIPVLVMMRFGVIDREEIYLAKKFGEEYIRYKARVRRWL